MTTEADALIDPATNPDAFPSAAHAYEFVGSSYQMMLSRFESGHTRLQNLATLIPSFMFAAIAFVGATGAHVDFHSWWFMASLAAAVTAFAVTWVARFKWSKFRQISPTKLYEDEIAWEPNAFKARMVGFAGLDFEDNLERVEWLYRSALTVSVLFALSVALLVVWVSRATS